MDTEPTRSVPLEDFLRGLYPAQSQGLLELRALPSGIQDFIDPIHTYKVRRFIKQHSHENVHFGVATRRRSGDGSLSNCADVWAAWVDIDFKTTQEDQARDLLRAFPIPPSISVRSGHGLHAYWLLRHPVDALRDEAGLRSVLQRLAEALGGDRSATDPSRVLRLPYTLNHKYTPPRFVTIELCEPHRCYRFEELDDALPALPQPSTIPSRATAPLQIPRGTRNNTLFRTGRALKLRGLGSDAILAALLEENRTKCNPPLPDDEVRQLAQHVVAQPDRPEFAPGSPFSLERSEDSGNSENPLAWDAPTPFHETVVPPFPTDALPDWVRDFVEAIAIETQTPPDLAGMVTLDAISASCAGVVQVEVRPGWVEPLNIYTAVAMDPGNRKSAVFKAAVEPLARVEELSNLERAPLIIVAQSRHEAARQRLKDAQTALKKTTPEEQAQRQEEVERCASQLSEIRIPPTCRRLADDITPEKVASLLAEQDGRLAILSAEGDIFDVMAGRYGAAGMSNLGVFLKAHAGDAIRVDRIGRVAEYVRRPALTIGLTTQLEVIRGLNRRPDFRGRGLLARFLYAIPPSLMGRREIRPRAAGRRILSAYNHAIEKLAAITAERDEAETLRAHGLTLSSNAQRCLADFESWLEPQLAPLGELAHMTDWAGKLAGVVVRIAGLLHMANHCWTMSPAPWDIQITRNTLADAIELGHYLLAHAQVAYALMGADPDVERAEFILAWLSAHQKSTFTIRELYQGTKGRFKKVADLVPGLSVLVEHGFIRPVAAVLHPGPGRKPSPRYDVNPLAYAQNAHNPQITRPASPGTTEARQ